MLDIRGTLFRVLGHWNSWHRLLLAMFWRLIPSVGLSHLQPSHDEEQLQGSSPSQPDPPGLNLIFTWEPFLVRNLVHLQKGNFLVIPVPEDAFGSGFAVDHF
jgi:hypothetical protein